MINGHTSLLLKDHHPKPPKLVCKNQFPQRMTSYHNDSQYTCSHMVQCGRLDCPACAAAWRKKHRAKINYGASILEDTPGYFITLTVEGPGHTKKQRQKLLHELKQAFYTLRHTYFNQTLKGSYYVCAFEFGTKKRRPHLHLLLYPPKPIALIPRIAKHQTLRNWQSTLDADAKQFQQKLISHGFGRLAHSEKLRYGARGATTYLGKYLSKADSKQSYARPTLTPDGLVLRRRSRLINYSRNWPVNPPIDTFFHGLTHTDRENNYPECPLCDCKPRTPQELHYENKRAIRHWLEPLKNLDPYTLSEMIKNFVRCYRNFHYYCYTQVDILNSCPDRTAAYNKIMFTVRLYNAQKDAALKALRYLGYRGSQKLLFYLYKHLELI